MSASRPQHGPPRPEDFVLVEGSRGPRRDFRIAVGLRPCSGAILVMSFSLLNGLYLGGVLSVLAMSIGTAITVTILATIAVTAKDLALRLAGPRSRTGFWLGQAIEIGGAVFVLLVGLALLGASLQYGGFTGAGA